MQSTDAHSCWRQAVTAVNRCKPKSIMATQMMDAGSKRHNNDTHNFLYSFCRTPLPAAAACWARPSLPSPPRAPSAATSPSMLDGACKLSLVPPLRANAKGVMPGTPSGAAAATLRTSLVAAASSAAAAASPACWSDPLAQAAPLLRCKPQPYHAQAFALPLVACGNAGLCDSPPIQTAK